MCGYRIDQAKVEKLRGGQITIFEPGLEKIFLKNIKERRLNFSVEFEDTIVRVEITFVALAKPTSVDGTTYLNMYWV